MFSRSHDRNCFLGFISASWHNSCNLLVKSWAALISCYTELRASSRLALVQPPRLSDWCLSWSRTLCGCYRLAQQKPGSRSALNCTHTFHFSAPSTPKPQAEHPTMGGLLPRCPPHLVGAATCQMLFLNARNIVANIQRPCWLHSADLTNVCHRLKSQIKRVWSIVILENIVYIQMHRKFKEHEKCWSSGCLQLEVLALKSLVTNWFWEGSR